jgi:hypothetical protein
MSKENYNKMKHTKNLARLIMLFSIFFSLVSCSSGELSRSKAEELIRQKFQYPQDTKFVKCYTLKGYGKGAQYADRLQAYQLQLEQLQSAGLLTYYTEDSRTDPSCVDFVTKFTAKATQYLVGSPGRDDENGSNQSVYVKVGFLDFGEITGIVTQPGLNVAQVNYTEKVTNMTPFGIALNIPQQTFNRKATFTKYDDGWRIGN